MRLLFVSCLLLGTAAKSSDNPAVTTTPKGAFPFSGSLTWGHSLGQGSFVQNYYARDASYSQSLGLNGSWNLPWKGVSLSAKQSWSMELTTGGVMRNHELNYGDIGLTLNIPTKLSLFGFRSRASFGAGIPVSKVSRFMGKMTGVSGTFGGTRKFGEKWRVSLGASVSRAIYTERARTVTMNEGREFIDSAGNTLTPYNQICRAEEVMKDPSGAVTGCLVSGVNGSFGVTSFVTVIYSPSKKWSYSLATVLIQSFKDHSLPSDQFTSSYANTGIGRSELTQGSLGVGYKYSKRLNFTLRTSSRQPALFWSSNDVVDENGNVTEARPGSWYPNFPWWDFRTPGNNFSSFSLDASYSF